MKKYVINMILIFLIAAELTTLIMLALHKNKNTQDAVEINEALQAVQEHWPTIDSYKNQTSLDYVVLDSQNAVLYKTKNGLSESINKAIIHRDTILDIEIDGTVQGKLIINNNSIELMQSKIQQTVIIFAIVLFFQCIICIGYMFYLNKMIVAPFQKLKGFAERIANGCLDVPLTMDRQNIFGAFTESFDIMRSELKKARIAEAEANASKKELVAKLSHDIKTPVASIKAASELGTALTDDKTLRENFNQITQKTDQINALISNLFTATLEEMKQLTVTPADISSRQLNAILENSDYLRRANIPALPDCLLYADKLRLQQVFDNLFANSYKYANTPIHLMANQTNSHLAVIIEDEGGGVPAKELPLLKEKFKRGSNAKDIEGAGLGLYISDYFMKEMNGKLFIENGEHGLKVTVLIALSGAI